MRPNALKECFRQRRVAVNAWLSINSSYLAEGVGHEGFDSVTVDLQHGMIGFDAALPMLQAISATQAVPLVRVSQNDPAEIMHMLDAGAYGVICPMISSADDAARLVSSCRYPLKGKRSFGPSRGLMYGGADYFQHANEEILAIPMIETLEAVDEIDAILAVEGVEMIYVGPNDLALGFGEMPRSESEGTRTEAAIATVLAAVKSSGKTAGIFCSGGPGARLRAEQGFDLVTPGNDFGMLRRAMAETIAQTRTYATAAE